MLFNFNDALSLFYKSYAEKLLTTRAPQKQTLTPPMIKRNLRKQNRVKYLRLKGKMNFGRYIKISKIFFPTKETMTKNL